MYKPDTMRSKLDELLNRIDIANTSNKYTDWISKLKLTSEFPVINKSRGLKLIYTIKSQELPEQERRIRESLIRKEHKGRFDNLPEYFGYQQVALNNYLKSRSQILKLRLVSQEEFDFTDGKIIFNLGDEIN